MKDYIVTAVVIILVPVPDGVKLNRAKAIKVAESFIEERLDGSMFQVAMCAPDEVETTEWSPSN